MTLPIYDMSTEAGRELLRQRIAKLQQTTSATTEAAATVRQIVDDVRQDGDEAVARYMRKWTDPSFSPERIRVSAGELAAAEAKLDPAMRAAILGSIANVRAYQEHIKPRDSALIEIDGATLGLRFTPVDSLGLMVPGGKAVLFSSLIMLAVPAQVAGVDSKNISVVNPPPDRREGQSASDISPLALATCKLLGIERVYRIGGAQAVAALAFGTKQVQRVDMIAGPGNVFVQLAKQQLGGLVGSDNGFYGPSEIVTVADESANPARVAADLLAQAEHNPGKCFLVAWSKQVIDRIQDQIAAQMSARKRGEAIEKALRDESAAVLVKDEAQAAQLADTFAAEHVNLAVADPAAWLARLKHGGEFFLGDQTPVAAGDYVAGPSHCLPTGTTARFASGVSVYTFLKRSGTVEYKKGMSKKTIDAIAAFAEAEGLDAHAASARVRGKSAKPQA